METRNDIRIVMHTPPFCCQIGSDNIHNISYFDKNDNLKKMEYRRNSLQLFVFSKTHIYVYVKMIRTNKKEK